MAKKKTGGKNRQYKPGRVKAGPANIKWIRIIRHNNVPTVYFESSDPNQPHGFFVLNNNTLQSAINLVTEMESNGTVQHTPASNPLTRFYGHSDIILDDQSTTILVDPDTGSGPYLETVSVA